MFSFHSDNRRPTAFPRGYRHIGGWHGCSGSALAFTRFARATGGGSAYRFERVESGYARRAAAAAAGTAITIVNGVLDDLRATS